MLLEIAECGVGWFPTPVGKAPDVDNPRKLYVQFTTPEFGSGDFEESIQFMDLLYILLVNERRRIHMSLLEQEATVYLHTTVNITRLSCHNRLFNQRLVWHFLNMSRCPILMYHAHWLDLWKIWWFVLVFYFKSECHILLTCRQWRVHLFQRTLGPLNFYMNCYGNSDYYPVVCWLKVNAVLLCEH